jgi:hypothetical protein
MRKVNAWILSATLVLALVLVWASASGRIGLSLPWAVVLAWASTWCCYSGSIARSYTNYWVPGVAEVARPHLHKE